MHINIYEYINAYQLVKKGFNVKWSMLKLALCETQAKAIYISKCVLRGYYEMIGWIPIRVFT